MTSLKVAETLKELRHHCGFTQKQLSEQLHISRQAYSNYENGTRLPDLETACVIADYFKSRWINWFVLDSIPKNRQIHLPHFQKICKIFCQITTACR